MKTTHVALLLGALLVGCRTQKETGVTGVELSITFEASLGLDQLRVEGSQSGTSVGTAKVVPTTPRALRSPETVAILLPDSAAGKSLDLQVDGLKRGAIVASTLVTVTLSKGQMVKASATLGAPLVCGDGRIAANEACDDSNTTAGEGCSDTCTVEPGYICTGEPSVCILACGNGIVDVAMGETCDDGARDAGDGCTPMCTVESGYGCIGNPSDCTLLCGNGLADPQEACDDGGRADDDGCSATCTIEPGWGCTTAPSTCMFLCGNGVTDGNEGCDDANGSDTDGCTTLCTVDPLYTCDNGVSPSVCTAKCGNGVLDDGETCDTQDLAGQSCLSRGRLQGGGSGLACDSACGSFVLGGCDGPDINTVANIRLALAEAFASAGHETIAIHGNSYNVSSPIVVSECNDSTPAPEACTGELPFGVTLKPLTSAAVTFTGNATPMLQVLSGNNVFSNLKFSNPTTAMQLYATVNAAGDNTVENCVFEKTDTTSNRQFIDIRSTGNTIQNNRLLNSASTEVDFAIQLSTTAAPTVIVGNYFYGHFTNAINMLSTMGVTKIDHNTFNLTDGYGITVNGASKLCIRNNIIDGLSSAVGWNLTSIAMGDSTDCGGHPSDGNNISGVNQCEINGNCITYCFDSPTRKALCRTAHAPGLNSHGCLSVPPLPATNPLRDLGVDLGYDLTEGQDGPFTGTAPDIGAREQSSTKTYAGVASVCD